jgi:hypothetical protein
VPPHVRRSKSIETLLPILYPKGISTGDFSDALAALLGRDAPGLSPTAIIRLRLKTSSGLRRKAVHSGADRCDAGRPQGTRRLADGGARKCAGLARTAARSETVRAHLAAGTGNRRQRARLLEGCRRSLARCESNAAGCTRPRTCSAYPRASRRLDERAAKRTTHRGRGGKKPCGWRQ